MGVYLNPGSEGFRQSIHSEIYVDKSGLISYTNQLIQTEQKYICVSRPRRFGKSMAVNMLTAYYGYGSDSDHLFQNLTIGKDPSYLKYLNQYDVIRINMQSFLGKAGSIEDMLSLLQTRLLNELALAYPVEGMDRVHLDWGMQEVYAKTHRPFIILIDEWDCFFREYRNDTDTQKKYLDFLRVWLKDQEYVGLAYMTGILPIKKYGTHSALNMFDEYSIANPMGLACYYGFTENEVKNLCIGYGMDFEEAKAWYDGYQLRISGRQGENIRNTVSMYNPKSVVMAMLSGTYDNYWNRTETYEALQDYIQLNCGGLRDDIIRMLAGEQVKVNISKFANDMITFKSKDDVLTLLIHLGYLAYDNWNQAAAVPNKEIGAEFANAVEGAGWTETAKLIRSSEQLLADLWNLDEAAVADGIALAHQEISILQYNDENSLSCTINLAFYAAVEYYNLVREMPAGKGFADICFVPRPLHLDKPAVLIELKWDQSAETAITQMKQKQYPDCLKDYREGMIIAGINYNRKTKTHECKIEKLKDS